MAVAATDPLVVLRNSAARLRALVEPLTGAQLRARAYPSEWSIADVLSHLGSGGTIMLANLDASVSGEAVPDGFVQPIWDEWNAKPPEAIAADSLAVDARLGERAEAFTAEERARVKLAFGPVSLDFLHAIRMRLNEHALHTWDVEVVLDPTATVAPDAAALVVDNLELIVRFVGKPTGVVHDVHVHTTGSERDFTLALGAEGVSLTPAMGATEPDLELPAEAFVRLVYGRLDADHTPPVRGSADLDELRRAFPGI